MPHAEHIDLAWLAGIFEGEGSLVICLTQRKEGGFHLACQSSITNTDKNIIDEVCRISKHFGISYHKFWTKIRNISIGKLRERFIGMDKIRQLNCIVY